MQQESYPSDSINSTYPLKIVQKKSLPPDTHTHTHTHTRTHTHARTHTRMHAHFLHCNILFVSLVSQSSVAVVNILSV